METFYKKICPAYVKVINKIQEKKFETSAVQGQIIYNSPLGYCYVHSETKTNEFTLVRPGFMWEDNKSDHKKHSPDEIYKPLNSHH